MVSTRAKSSQFFNQSKTYNDRDHSHGGFPADEKSAKSQNYNRYWNSDDGEIELSIVFMRRDDNEELDRKSEEEKEIELQKGDVDLQDKMSVNK